MDYASTDAAPESIAADPVVNNATSFVDPESEFEGTLITRNDLRIEGQLRGTIQCQGTLMVAEGAVVDAEIDASSIIVSGDMSGTVRCEGRLEIRATGEVRGHVTTGALVIVEGAQYEGEITMDPSRLQHENRAFEEPTTEPEDDLPADSEESYSFLRRFAHDEGTEEDELAQNEPDS